jgi:hypothetical protein
MIVENSSESQFCVQYGMALLIGHIPLRKLISAHLQTLYSIPKKEHDCQ